MHKQYQDDFLFVGVSHKIRSMNPILQAGEFIDDWGCLFKGVSDGFGAHPTRLLIDFSERVCLVSGFVTVSACLLVLG